MNAAISKTAVVVAVKDQVSCSLQDEAVILHLKGGMYYGLNSVGATVWNALQQPCEQDLLHLLSELAAVGLIEVQDG